MANVKPIGGAELLLPYCPRIRVDDCHVLKKSSTTSMTKASSLMIMVWLPRR